MIGRVLAEMSRGEITAVVLTGYFGGVALVGGVFVWMIRKSL